MSPFETIKAAYAAFAHNDPSVLFGAMDPGIVWNEAEGNPLADRNPYVGAQAIGEGVFGRLVAAIHAFSAAPATEEFEPSMSTCTFAERPAWSSRAKSGGSCSPT